MLAQPAQAVVAAAVSKAEDLADLLGQRSPGTRTQDQLTKHARTAAKARVHPKVAAPHPLAPDGPTTDALVDLLLPREVPVEIASVELPQLLAPTPTLASILETTPGVTPPGGEGGGSRTFPSSEPREVIPPTSAVPEPGTWAMMLMGFGLVAWRVKRRRPTVRKAKPARS
jgi:hypothetical protein